MSQAKIPFLISSWTFPASIPLSSSPVIFKDSDWKKFQPFRKIAWNGFRTRKLTNPVFLNAIQANAVAPNLLAPRFGSVEGSLSVDCRGCDFACCGWVLVHRPGVADPWANVQWGRESAVCAREWKLWFQRAESSFSSTDSQFPSSPCTRLGSSCVGRGTGYLWQKKETCILKISLVSSILLSERLD